MGFPTNPTDGDIRILGSRQWQYSESAATWKRIPDPQVTAAEAKAGTVTDVRLFSPADVLTAIGNLSAVRQVLVDTLTNAVSTTASAGLATGLSKAITLSKADSRVMVLAMHNGLLSATAASNAKISLLRGTSVIAVLANAVGNTAILTGSMAVHVDSPGTVGPHTYSTKLFALDNTNAASINGSSNISALILVELGPA